MLFVMMIAGCGASDAARPSSMGPMEARELAHDEEPIVDAEHDGPADAEIEGVAAEPELTREDLIAEAERRRATLDDCPDLDARLEDLRGARDERTAWHRYALFIALADRCE